MAHRPSAVPLLAATLLATQVLLAAGPAAAAPPTSVPAAPTAVATPVTSAADPAPPASPFPIRGVVEGFYGPGWSESATEDVLAFMGAHGMNTFVYAPKDDPYQRALWQKPYPAADLARLQAMVAAASADGVDFVSSISPGLHIQYSSAADIASLEAKMAQLRSIGVHHFMLAFDDITGHLQDPADIAAYGNSLAAAQVDLADAVYVAERRIDPQFSLWFVPTSYWGTQPDAYLRGIASLLPGIQVAWTGPGVISPRITLAEARAYGAIVGRKPLLWLNFPVNDWTIPKAELNSGNLASMQPRDLFLGPLQGLAPDLASGVSGILANPMLEPHATEIPLASVASYLSDPSGAGVQAAWSTALDAAGGSAAAALRVFAAAEAAQPSLSPQGYYIWTSTDPTADALEQTVLSAAAGAPRSHAEAQLAATFHAWIADAPQLTAVRPGTPALAAEIAPWVAVMARDGQAGLDGLALLDALRSGDSAAAAAAQPAVAADLTALSAQPVQFGGHLATFLKAVQALAGPAS